MQIRIKHFGLYIGRDFKRGPDARCVEIRLIDRSNPEPYEYPCRINLEFGYNEGRFDFYSRIIPAWREVQSVRYEFLSTMTGNLKPLRERAA